MSKTQSLKDDIYLMDLALKQANDAYSEDEVPVGAVVVDSQGSVISEAHNEKETKNNPCGHAEVLALISAASKNNSWRLTGHTLYVTLEPCPMCLAAMVNARISRCVFGAYDPKGGALSLGYNFCRDKKLNHKFDITGGVLHYKCSSILSQFFREKRNFYKTDN